MINSMSLRKQRWILRLLMITSIMICKVSMFWFHHNSNTYLNCDAVVLITMNSRCCLCRSPSRLYMLHGNHHREERSIVVASSSSQQSSFFASSFHMSRTVLPTKITLLSRTRRRRRHVFSRVMNSDNNNDDNISYKYDYNSNYNKSHNSSYNYSSNNIFFSSRDDDGLSRQHGDNILSSATATTASLRSSKDIYMKRLKLTSTILMSSTSYFLSIQNNNYINSVNAIDYKNKNNIKDGAVGYEAAESAFAPGQQQLAVPILSQSALLNTLPINNLLIGQLQGFIESFVQLLNPSDKQINQIKLNSSLLWSNLRINAQRAAGMFLYNQVGR